MTPSEWGDADTRAIAELRATGTAKPFEKEFIRKDGTRVPVMLGGATFGEQQNQGVGFVLDLTARKQAEEDLRRSERRYHEAEMELAHANRVATVGQLSASIAHEVSQPIAAARINVDVARLSLSQQPPNVKEALE